MMDTEQKKRRLIIFGEIREDKDETPKVEESALFSMLKDGWYDFEDFEFCHSLKKLEKNETPYTNDKYSFLSITDALLCDVISSVLRDGYNNALYNSFKKVIKNYSTTHRRQIIKVIDRLIDVIAFLDFPELVEMTVELLNFKAENGLYESVETRFSL